LFQNWLTWNGQSPIQTQLNLVLIFFIITPNFIGSYEQNLFILIAFYAFAAVSWNIFCGYLGDLSLGHATFIGVGGYVSTLLFMYANISPWIGMIAGILVAMSFGVIIGFPCFRLKGAYITLTTIAFGELVRLLVTNNDVIFGIKINGASGLVIPYKQSSFSLFAFDSKLPYYYIIFIFLILALIISHLIKISKLGYYFAAIKSDPDAAESLGINIKKYKLIAMLISSGMIAVAGTFYAQYFAYIGPERIFSGDLSVEIALMALIGGQGTVLGPVFGAILLVPLTNFLSENFGGQIPGLNLFIYGIIMIFVVFFMPNGIHDYVMKAINFVQKKIGQLFYKKTSQSGRRKA